MSKTLYLLCDRRKANGRRTPYQVPHFNLISQPLTWHMMERLTDMTHIEDLSRSWSPSTSGGSRFAGWNDMLLQTCVPTHANTTRHLRTNCSCSNNLINSLLKNYGQRKLTSWLGTMYWKWWYPRFVLSKPTAPPAGWLVPILRQSRKRWSQRCK